MSKPQYATLGDLRSELAYRLGFGAQVKNGINKTLFNSFLQRSQSLLAKKLTNSLLRDEVLKTIAAYDSAIPYPDEIDPNQDFKISVDYSGTGNWYPLQEGIDYPHDSIYLTPPPRWRASTNYDLGDRVIPTTWDTFEYEATTLTPSVLAFQELNADYISIGVIGMTHFSATGYFPPNSVQVGDIAMPYETKAGTVSGIAIDRTADKVFVFAPFDASRAAGFAVGDAFPWASIRVVNQDGSGGDETVVAASFSAAEQTDAGAQSTYFGGVGVIDTDYVLFVASYTGTDPMGSSNDQCDVYLYGAEGEAFTGTTEPTWPAVVDNTVVDNQITWTARTSSVTSTDTNGWPRRYERLDDEIYLWPYAQGAYTLKFEGIRRLRDFTEDAHKATIDDDLILMQALVFAKAHYKHEDVDLIRQELQTAINFIRAGAHGTVRNIPVGRNKRGRRNIEMIRPGLIS